MAKVTGAPIALTTTWVKIVDLGETFMMSVLSGDGVFFSWSSSSPSAGDIGHPFFAGDTFGDSETTENCWVRADTTAMIVVSKE